MPWLRSLSAWERQRERLVLPSLTEIRRSDGMSETMTDLDPIEIDDSENIKTINNED